MSASEPGGGREMPRPRFLVVLASLLICLLIESVADLGLAVLRDGHGPVGYTLLVVGLSVILAAGLALVAARSPGATILALATWAALHGLGAGRIRLQLVSLAILGVTTWVVLKLAARFSLRPAISGMIVGSALGLGWIGTHAAIAVLDSDSASLTTFAMPHLAYAVALMGLVILTRLTLPIGQGLRILIAGGASLCGLTLAIGSPPILEPEGDSTAGRPNILVLLLDTVRADHMSIYGYELPTTPELEALRDHIPRTQVYPFAFSTGSWTLPAHASLFTGEIASVHQMHFGNGGLGGQIWSVDLGDTLAVVLANAGYRTHAMFANPALTTVGGIDAGFERWDYAEQPMLLNLPGEMARRKFLSHLYMKQGLTRPSALQVNRQILRQLDACRAGACFIFANYMEAHEPYLPGPVNAGRFRDPDVERGGVALELPANRERIDYMSHVYDEALRDLDADLGRLFDALDARGHLDDMWLVITSDHGEAFHEHGAILHGTNIYNEQARIPMVVVPPKNESLPAIEEPVSLVDLTATLSAVGTGKLLGQGRDLRNPAIRETPVLIEAFPYAAGDRNLGPRANKPSRAAVAGKWKLIEVEGRAELYDVKADPGETLNLAYEHAGRVEQMRGLLPPLEVRSDRVAKEGGMLDAQTLESLRAIGYAK